MVQLMKGRRFEVSSNLICEIKEGEGKICTANVVKLLPDMDASQTEKDLQEELLQSPIVKVTYTNKTYYVKDIQCNND